MKKPKYRTHPDFPDYQIYSNGKVLRNNKSLAQLPDKDGYLHCVLWHKNKRRNFRIHRLVAELFGDNFCKEKEVHHINGQRQDNNISNLLICTRSEHIEIKYEKQRQYYKEKYGDEPDDIQVICSETDNILHCSHCLGEAAEWTKVDKEVIREMLETQTRSHLCSPNYYFARF